MAYNDITADDYLDSDEERILIFSAQNGSKSATLKLIRSQVNFVRKIASIKNHGSMLDDYDDLVQEGIMGVMKAIEKFDLEKEFRFSTYSGFWINAYIGRYKAGNDHVVSIPVHLFDNHIKLSKFRAEFFNKNGFMPDDDTIMSSLNFSLHRYQEIKNYESIRYAYFDKEMTEDSGDTLASICADKSFNLEESVINEIDDKLIKYKLKSKLGNYEYYIFYLRIYKGLNYDEIGDTLGITKVRVGQILRNNSRNINAILNRKEQIDLFEIDKYNLEPIMPDELVKLFFVKQILDEDEYKMYYNINYDIRGYFYKKDLTKKEKSDYTILLERIKPLLEEIEENYDNCKEIFINSIESIGKFANKQVGPVTKEQCTYERRKLKYEKNKNNM